MFFIFYVLFFFWRFGEVHRGAFLVNLQRISSRRWSDKEGLEKGGSQDHLIGAMIRSFVLQGEEIFMDTPAGRPRIIP